MNYYHSSRNMKTLRHITLDVIRILRWVFVAEFKSENSIVNKY